ncbi:hypothetical protein K474DRAFT_1699531 [Panus rudis PR-1116 ss-1]|nr:hypothetical protein K474DRAFT_1699531 [Panus rudis PR-1116 ss-1]
MSLSDEVSILGEAYTVMVLCVGTCDRHEAAHGSLRSSKLQHLASLSTDRGGKTSPTDLPRADHPSDIGKVHGRPAPNSGTAPRHLAVTSSPPSRHTDEICKASVLVLKDDNSGLKDHDSGRTGVVELLTGKEVSRLRFVGMTVVGVVWKSMACCLGSVATADPESVRSNQASWTETESTPISEPRLLSAYSGKQRTHVWPVSTSNFSFKRENEDPVPSFKALRYGTRLHEVEVEVEACCAEVVKTCCVEVVEGLILHVESLELGRRGWFRRGFEFGGDGWCGWIRKRGTGQQRAAQDSGGHESDRRARREETKSGSGREGGAKVLVRWRMVRWRMVEDGSKKKKPIRVDPRKLSS